MSLPWPNWSEAEWREQLGLRAAGGPGSGRYPKGSGAQNIAGGITGAKFQAQVTPSVVEAAQAVYDDWDENVDEYAGGGICHLIADAVSSKLSDFGIQSSTVSAEQGDQHVWVVAQLADGVYNVDISPYEYERGGGYSWKKISGVKFTRDSVILERLSSDPDSMWEFVPDSSPEDWRGAGGPGSGRYPKGSGDWTPGSGEGGGVTSRPDGASIRQHPLLGSLAERRAIKIGDRVRYHYRAIGDDMGKDGQGRVVGFVSNNGRDRGSLQDVVIRDGDILKFVAEKNVRSTRPRPRILGGPGSGRYPKGSGGAQVGTPTSRHRTSMSAGSLRPGDELYRDGQTVVSVEKVPGDRVKVTLRPRGVRSTVSPTWDMALRMDIWRFDQPRTLGGPGSGRYPKGSGQNPSDSIENVKVYRGGVSNHNALVSYSTSNKEMAQSYVDMSNDRFGGGGALHESRVTLKNPAPESFIMEEARLFGIDTEGYTPASVFDAELHGRDAVAQLVKRMIYEGYDGAVLEDIAYGKPITDKAYITWNRGNREFRGMGGPGSGRYPKGSGAAGAAGDFSESELTSYSWGFMHDAHSQNQLQRQHPVTFRKGYAVGAEGSAIHNYLEQVNHYHDHQERLAFIAGHASAFYRQTFGPEAIATLGGPGSGRYPKGSGQNPQSGDGPGSSFTRESNKAWIRANQARYNSDPRFRATVDAITLLTQGGTRQIHAASAVAAGRREILTENLRELVNDESVKLDSAASPLASYKNYFEGQDVENADYVSLLDAGKALNDAVATAPPLDIPVFRGSSVAPALPNPNFMDEVAVSMDTARFTLPNPAHDRLLGLKPGDTFDIPGVASFTTDKFVAEQFSRGEARGQAGYESARRSTRDDHWTHVTFEVKPGARGLSVAGLSPWRQKEVLTRGQFRVVSVEKQERSRGMNLHILMEQTNAR